MRPLFHNPSMMSSFANQPRVSRREISYEPPASTQDRGAPPQWQKRTDASIRCPRSPPPRAVLPPIPRPHRGTGAAALLPAPQKRRRPRPSFDAPLRQRHALLLSACPAARLVYASAPACANRPPSPCHPQWGGGPTAPRGRHAFAPSSLLSHRLSLRTAAP